MSDKSKITSNDCKLAESIQSHLSKEGHVYQVASTVKHLGIQYNSARKRPVSILSSRFKKTRKRFLKSKMIASVSRKAKRLYAGSCFPSATWGHQSAGISPTQLEDLELNALSCAGNRAPGSCRFFSLLLAYGLNGQPLARIIRECMREWVILVKSLDNKFNNEKDLFAVTWRTARNKLKSQPIPFLIHHVHGFMSNIIYILRGAGWDPISMDLWADHNGQLVSIYTHNTDTLASLITYSYALSRFKSCYTHENGKGIEGGVELIFKFSRCFIMCYIWWHMAHAARS